MYRQTCVTTKIGHYMSFAFCLLFLYTVLYRLRKGGKVTSPTRFNEVSSITLWNFFTLN